MGEGRPPLTWQLDDGGYVLDLRRPSRRSRPAPPPAEGQAVLLVSRVADAELDVVAGLLTAVGVPVARLDADTIADAGVAIDLDRRSVLVHGRWISPSVAWLRHFSRRAIAADGGSARQQFDADSWQALADQLALISTTAIGATRPGLLAQLLAARSLGIAIPRTVVSTDLAVARELLGGAEVVVKALPEHFVEARPGLLSGAFAEVVSRAELPAGGGPPAVVQERVSHEAELRVYYLDGEVIAAFSIAKPDPAALWQAPGQVRAELVDPPPAQASAAVRALAAALGLRYGAFDLLISAGEPVFLEVNVAGDWRWLESGSGRSPVTEAAAATLIRLHEAASPGQRRAAVDPLAFLSAGAIRQQAVDKG